MLSSAINKTSACDTSPFNLVPNLDFVTPASETGASYNKNATLEPDFQQRQNDDLIQLRFESILTSDEKEYFSLEYFDPLHRKGRSALGCISPNTPKDFYANYSFAKPPEDDKDKVNRDGNAWVTFDNDISVFGEGGTKRPLGKDDSLPKPTAHGVTDEKTDYFKVNDSFKEFSLKRGR